MDSRSPPKTRRSATELRDWLDENLPKFLADWDGDDDPRRRRRRPASSARQERRQDWQRRLNEGRWAAINWPKEWNGREATPVQNAIYSEEMARVRAPGIYNANGLWQIGPMIIHGAPRSRSSAGCPASSPPTSTGARASPSPRPAPTSRTCARWRSATATSTS